MLHHFEEPLRGEIATVCVARGNPATLLPQSMNFSLPSTQKRKRNETWARFVVNNRPSAADVSRLPAKLGIMPGDTRRTGQGDGKHSERDDGPNGPSHPSDLREISGGQTTAVRGPPFGRTAGPADVGAETPRDSPGLAARGGAENRRKASRGQRDIGHFCGTATATRGSLVRIWPGARR